MLVLYSVTALLVFVLSLFLTMWVAFSDKPVWKKVSWAVLDLICSILWLPILAFLSVYTVYKPLKENFFKKYLEK